MRAMVLNAYGLTPQLEQRPDPKPKAGEVLVRVHATSVNPVDWKQASGKARPFLSGDFPGFIPGYDVAGVVEELGEGVAGFTKGQRVHTRLSGTKGGACADLVIAGLDVLRPLPDSVDFAQGAGLPLAGMTALQGLRDGCMLPMKGATGRVLIIGGSGGVGHLAVQIARSMGATVIGVCSKKNESLVRRLGAHEVIDYTNPTAWKHVAPFDAIFDCIGSPVSDYLDKLTEKGRFASCAPGPSVFANAALNLVRSRKVVPVLLKVNAPDLAILDALQLEVVIDSRFPLTELPAAWAKSITGRVVGKIIIDVKSD